MCNTKLTRMLFTAVRIHSVVKTGQTCSIQLYLTMARQSAQFLRWSHNADVQGRCMVDGCRYTTDEPTEITELIRKHTVVTRDHMTPEIALHLITDQCPLFTSDGHKCPFKEPFWAFYWPGGQVLTRFILDNPSLFSGQKVVDVGSGCGASAIACRMTGAIKVVANDTDTESIAAIKLNAGENGVRVETCNSNLIGHYSERWSTILLGDMFYDEAFRDSVTDWLVEHYKRYKTNIFIGDPGRHPLQNNPFQDKLTKVGEYILSKECRQENYGFSVGYVWKVEF